MSQMIVCRCCLETDKKLFSLSDKQLVQILDEFIGIPKPNRDDLPLYICGICLHLIKKFKIFKQQCYRASYKLQQLLMSSQLTVKNIKSINRNLFINKFKTTQTEIISYLPPSKEFETTIFHIELATEAGTTEKLLSEAKTRDFMDNYVDCVAENEVEIKEEYPIDNITNIVPNIKIDNINHEDLTNNDINDSDYLNNENDFTEDNNETDIEIKEETDKTKVKKNKIDKTDSITENTSQKGFNNKNTTRKRNIAHTRAKSKKKKEDTDEAEEELDPVDRNVRLFYNCHPDKQISDDKMQKQMYMLDKFSKSYNVEVRFLSSEEQKMELEQRRRYYQNQPYTCELCYRGYSMLETYNAHMEVHDPSSGDFECHVCKIRCKTNRDREKHINATHLKRFTCKQCGIVTKSQSYARAHFARHAGTSFACDQCGKKFTQQTNYLSHMRAAHSSRARVCPLCYDTFLGPIGLRVHIGVVHRQAVRCRSCSTQFENETALNKHLEASADNACEPGLRPCPMCGLNFETEKVMKKHYEELHTTELKCKKCGKLFPTKVRLATHLQEHHRSEGPSEDTRYICECCGKCNFKNLNQLRYHQRLHTGERPYKCSHCAKTFRLSSLLQCHMYIHTDERRYKCPTCPKAFRQPAHRTAHLLTHTKERPYACSACPKRYTSATAAREHADTVHRGLPARRRDKNKAI